MSSQFRQVPCAAAPGKLAPVTRGAVPEASGSGSAPGKSLRQSTRKGAFRIASFFILASVIAVALNAAINFGLKRITVSKFGALNRVMSGQVNADILINGSSRALSHYDPRILQNLTGRSAYNIGQNASQIDFELAFLKTYLDHNPKKPGLVIQNLDLFSFETTKKGELYDPGLYVPYMDDSNLYDFIRQKEPDAWKTRYLPLYGYAVEDMRFTWVWGLLRCAGVQGPEDYYQGFNPRPATWNADFEHFRAGNEGGVSYRVEPEGIHCLEELITLCKKNGIQIILVYSPEYCEMQKLETNRKEIMGKFHEISEQLKVPFWDYSDSSISSERNYFNNSEHLNVEGAEVFSQDLAQRLVTEFSQWSVRSTMVDSGSGNSQVQGAQQPVWALSNSDVVREATDEADSSGAR
jgi:hypothetical protein